MDVDELKRAVAADVARCVEAVDAESVAAVAEVLAERREVFLIGTGRSGAMLAAMAVRLGHLGVGAHVVGAAGCPEIKPGDFVLVGSGSGRTPVPLERTQARRAGASVAVITADPDSPIARMADRVIHIPAPAAPQDGSAALAAGGTPHTLRSLFEECLLILCDCVCRLLQDKLGLTTADMQSRHARNE